MPAKSKAQQRAMAIAEHAPETLHAANRGLLGMSQAQLHDYAATPTKHLPMRAKKKPHPPAKPAPHPHHESYRYNWRQRAGLKRGR